ncbi:MAG: hypothetical protein C5B50_25455 [Verrucomicrobia bacterium]|nr:MAG: hypothetical protein C5B50_25455 [Verrucomicrobiota bacterium]
MNRLFKTVLPDGGIVTNDYYATGQPRTISGARTYPSASGFDSQRRQNGLTNWTAFPTTGSRATAWAYDQYRGFLTGKTYPGNTPGPAYGYTAAGRLSSRTWARGTNTTYSWTGAGDVGAISYSDSSPGLVTAFDRRGRQIASSSTFLSLSSISRTLDDAGDLISEAYTTGPLAGLSVTNSLDPLLRRTNLALLSSNSKLLSSSFGFDAASRLKTVRDGTNTAAYSYLANSPLISQIFYTNNGSLRMIQTRQYDNLNRLTNLTWTVGSTVIASFTYQYNSANQRTKVTWADGSYWLFGYDSLGQVTSAKHYWADGTLVAGQQFEHTFDDIGNRLTTRAGGDQWGSSMRFAAYTNNNLNQILSRNVPPYLEVIGSANSNATLTLWSPAGPLSTPAGNYAKTVRHADYFWTELVPNNSTGAVWVSASTLAVLQNGTNADTITTNLGSIFLPQTPQIFAHDPDGNLTNNGRFSITCDTENRATLFDPLIPYQRVACSYDPLSRRVTKDVFPWRPTVLSYGLATRQNFVYDGWNLIAVLDINTNLLYSFTWGLDLSGTPQGAGGVGGLISMTVYSGTNAGTYFYVSDGNGNVAALVNAATGNVAAQYEYGPFGQVLRATGPMAFTNPFLFSTKFYDWETGLYYYGYRYYDPSTGRWLSRDAIGESAGMNLFGFSYNSPQQFADSDGRQIFLASPPVDLFLRAGPELAGSETIIRIGPGPTSTSTSGLGQFQPIPGTGLMPPVPVIAPQPGTLPQPQPQPQVQPRPGAAKPDKKPDQEGDNAPHAGEWHAQYGGLQKFPQNRVIWRREVPLTKSQGLERLEILRGQLNPRIRNLLEESFDDARKWVNGRSSTGVQAFYLKSWPKNAGRCWHLDVEVVTGSAFVDDPAPPPIYRRYSGPMAVIAY